MTGHGLDPARGTLPGTSVEKSLSWNPTGRFHVVDNDGQKDHDHRDWLKANFCDVTGIQRILAWVTVGRFTRTMMRGATVAVGCRVTSAVNTDGLDRVAGTARDEKTANGSANQE